MEEEASEGQKSCDSSGNLVTYRGLNDYMHMEKGTTFLTETQLKIEREKTGSHEHIPV